MNKLSRQSAKKCIDHPKTEHEFLLMFLEGHEPAKHAH